VVLRAQLARSDDPRLWQHRNLGKAFYENPTTQKQAVDEFKQALALAPNSIREQLNYGIALLRAGDVQGGIAQLEKVQKEDPKLPHTWFNLGVIFQKQGEFDKAAQQFQGMVKLVPDEPVSHYHLGALHKMNNEMEAAVKEFETARDLNPRLAAPHFQLYGLYRQMNRPQDATRELQTFQDLKKQAEGAAVPEDMDWSYWAEIYDPLDAPGAPPAPATYRDEKLGSGFTGFTIALVDGVKPSIIAWSDDGVTVFAGGSRRVTDSGLEGLKGVRFVAPGDFDNDGRPDLCVVTATGAELYRNVNGKFQKFADLAKGSFRTAVWMDFDHDYDLDVFLLGEDSRLMRNNGTAGFSDESARFPFVKGSALDGVRFELEHDTPGFDLVVSYADRPGVLYRDQLGGNYKAVDLPLLPAGAKGLVAFDQNRDGRMDLAAAPDLLLLNKPNGFEKATAPHANEAFADFTGNGRLDRVVLRPDGLYLGHNTTANYGNWIEISLIGVKNLKLGLDAKVEVKSGTLYQKAIYEGIPIVVRLGSRNRVDTVRITWPNGLVQNEMSLPINKVAVIKEAQRLSGSCPMIFTWNGDRFEFITDVLGVAPLGASSGDGQYFPVDHDEYVSIPAESLHERDGRYEVRVTEELREVSYIDQIKLIALDHPADTTIITNEKFKSPPFPEFRLFGVKRQVYPKGPDSVLRRDHVYPDDFRRDSAGVAELHHLDLDFGSAARDNRAVLILHGWVDWADGSTFLGAMQAKQDLVFPYLQVRDAAGKWKTVVEDMGIPSGKPKTMAVDLTGKFLSASREVRIVTNLCVYWDEIFLSEDASAPETRLTTAPMLSADLHFRGFSKATIHPQRKQPEQFDYSTVSPTSMWNPTSGNYTRYGDVQSLLAEPEDRMVIMGSGDEMRLEFDARGLPPVPTGWRRDFLLLVDGWAKDADANTAFSQTVLPLPFHKMSSYPYPAGEHYPDDEVHSRYQGEYNIRPALRLLRPLGSD
jgi:tetratricopeptide (TPR) repeat protein